jgi:hypothetical protein
MRPSGKPDVPGAAAEAPGAVRRPEERRTEDRRLPDRRASDRRPDDRRATDRRVADVPVGEDRRVADRRQAERRLDDRRRADERRPVEDRGRVPVPAAPADDNPSTGPIPVVTDGADEADAAPKEGALAWARFAGELVIALAAGVAIYFLFTAIWENLPYVAVVLAPLAVTGLVAGVGAYRHKLARQPVGPRLLAVLVFAGALLTMWPAANLLSVG